MNLLVPTVGSEQGPLYASDINNSLTLIDSHNHSPGQGVQITPSGININAALPFNNNPISGASYVNLSLSTGAPSAAQSLYVQNGSESTPLPDLWYFDGTNDIQLTSAGIVNAVAGALPGESYAGGTFAWKQGAGSTTPAIFDLGYLALRPIVAGTTLFTIVQVASGLGTSNVFTLPSVNIQMPTGLPPFNQFLALDASGNMTTPANGTMPAGQLAANSVTGGQIATAGSGNGITATNINYYTIVGGVLGNIAGGTIQGNGTVGGFSNIAAGTISAYNITANSLTGGDGGSLAYQTIVGSGGGSGPSHSNISPATIGAEDIKIGAVTETQIALGTITHFNIAPATIQGTNINPGAITGNLLAPWTMASVAVSSALTTSPTYQNRGTLNITLPQSGANRPTIITTNYSGAPIGTSTSSGLQIVNTTTGAAYNYVVSTGAPVYDFSAVVGVNSYQIQIASFDGGTFGLTGTVFYAMQY